MTFAILLICGQPNIQQCFWNMCLNNLLVIIAVAPALLGRFKEVYTIIIEISMTELNWNYKAKILEF